MVVSPPPLRGSITGQLPLVGPALHPSLQGARPRGGRRARSIPAIKRRPKGLRAVASSLRKRICGLIPLLRTTLRHRRRSPLHHVVIGLSASRCGRGIGFDTVRPPCLDRLPHSPDSPSHASATRPPKAAR